jgi:hypothetical protein
MSVLGLDIGGANLKAAHSCGIALSHPFELWKQPGSLADALRGLLRQLPAAELLAVTMTGELCDCFETKRQGVEAILDAVAAAAAGQAVRVWGSDGCFRDVARARAEPDRVAAANWLALARFAGRFAPRGAALVVDIGSTTTDIVPLMDGQPAPQGRTDPERLAARELVYTGIRRTPVCALLGADGAAELFANTQDVYLLLGRLAEDAEDRRTADGRPATRAAAAARLARMRCADLDSMTAEEIDELARNIRDRQLAILAEALATVTGRLPEPPRLVVAAGAGEFLVVDVLARSELLRRVPLLSLADRLGAELSTAACAYALAVLAPASVTGASGSD